ncbi:hypothetical protein CDAR_66481 [Caerostris darwini]|uniref:RRM domain-containing protein n=1 Tax=Caerostris darwini TaxID=1538125 RepID=A0AAV4RRE6_9ARAC|nr:hypothetical protein CDAR_66481 [Caerostris darwini]
MAVKELNGKNNRGRPLYIKGEKKCNYSAAEEHYKKIYVKNMDLNWDNSDLIEEFEIFGEIEEAKISMTDGKSKGFGFVKFYNHSSAKKAIEVMHGKFINNKQLIVEPFTYKENSKSSDDSVKKQYDSFQLNNLFIKNLPKNMVEIELSDLFKKFGAIQSVRVATDSENKSKGYGFVCFSNKEIAAKARDQMNGMSYKSQILEVDFYKKKSNYVSSSRHSNNKINMFDQEIKSSTPSFRTRKNTIFSFSG